MNLKKMTIRGKAPVMLFFSVVIFLIYCSQGDRELKEGFPALRGEYLGQEIPGSIPELFAPGIVSTRHYENSITFSPEGKEIYFAMAAPPNLYVIVFMRQENNQWSSPQVAPFSGRYKDGFPFISPGGKRLYFSSKRPLSQEGEPKKDWDIWFVEKTGKGWSKPQALSFPVNSKDNDKSPSVTRDGTLYFSRSRKLSSNIYRSRPVESNFTTPEKLGDAINTEYYEDHPFIAPDESFIIFSSFERPEGIGKADLYISFRNQEGSWTKAQNMGKQFNTKTHENCPVISPDGKFFFFNSYRRSTYKKYWEKSLTYDKAMRIIDVQNVYYPDGCPNFYWVDSKVIDQFHIQGNKRRNK